MKKWFLFSAALMSLSVFAQPKLRWVNEFKGNLYSYNEVLETSADTFGNIYTTGYFTDSIEMDTANGGKYFTSAGDYDIFVSMQNKYGDLIWTAHFGNWGFDAGVGIYVDPGQNVYVTGTFEDTVDFDPDTGVTNLVANGYYDAFIVKLDKNGKLVWAKSVGGTGYDIGFGITADKSGNVIATGFFEETADFDPGSSTYNFTAGGYEDGFVVKLSSSGAFTWADQFTGYNGTETCTGRTIKTDANGNIFIAGAFNDTYDFNPGSGTSNLASNGNDDIYIVKLTSTGGFSFAKQIGGTGAESAEKITLDNSGSIVLVGTFSDVVDFNPGSSTFNLTAVDLLDAYVLKLDANGNYTWAKKVGGLNDDYAYSVAMDASNNYYIVTSFSGTVDFDPGASTKNLVGFGDQDMVLLTLNSSGVYQNTLQFGGKNAYVYGGHISITKSGDIFVAGAFNGKVDFDPSSDSSWHSAIDRLSVYIMKLSECKASTSSITTTACKTYTLNGQTYTQSGTYTQHLTNYTGCDSAITLKLTMLQNTGAFSASACSTYVWNSQTYNASGKYTQTFTNYKGCDSVVTLTLIINNQYDTLVEAACNVYILNGQTYTTSGVYNQTLTTYKGCDSFITLFLTIGSQATYGSISQSVCNTYTYHGKTYTSSGVYKDTLVNVSGCDSFVTLTLNIRKSTTYNLNPVVCNSYIFQGITYYTSGLYKFYLLNAAGCDSIINLNLTINKVNIGVTQSGHTLTASANGATYQWLNCSTMAKVSGAVNQSFTPSVDGNYAVEVKENNCTDTSACYPVTGLGVSEINGNIFRVYPNPASDFINIVFTNQSSGMVRILGLTGDRILEQRYALGSTEVDVQKLAGGLYIVECESNGVKSRQQILIRK